jgi:hypothetical protein
MHTGRAFLTGVLAGAVVILLTSILRALGLPVNLALMLGTMLGLAPSVGTWFAGLVIHLVVSGLIAMLYAAGFEYWTHRAGGSVGLGFSLIHMLIAGLLFGAIPAIHPMIPEFMRAPGPFMSNLGASGVLLFIAVHLFYGWIVGAYYGPVRNRPVTHAHV